MLSNRLVRCRFNYDIGLCGDQRTHTHHEGDAVLLCERRPARNGAPPADGRNFNAGAEVTPPDMLEKQACNGASAEYRDTHGFLPSREKRTILP